MTGDVALTMDIVMDAKEDKEAFIIIEDGTIKTDAHREGKRYFVDVVLEDEN